VSNASPKVNSAQPDMFFASRQDSFLADTKPDVYALLAHMVAKPSLDASLMSTGFHVGNFD
jgi:hypothetical protein